MNEEIELTDEDIQEVSFDVSEERVKELEDQGIILNYKILSRPVDTRTDNQKVLDAFNSQRARLVSNHLMMPLLRNTLTRDRVQDTSGNPKIGFITLAAHGALIEDRNVKRRLN